MWGKPRKHVQTEVKGTRQSRTAFLRERRRRPEGGERTFDGESSRVGDPRIIVGGAWRREGDSCRSAPALSRFFLKIACVCDGNVADGAAPPARARAGARGADIPFGRSQQCGEPKSPGAITRCLIVFRHCFFVFSVNFFKYSKFTTPVRHALCGKRTLSACSSVRAGQHQRIHGRQGAAPLARFTQRRACGREVGVCGGDDRQGAGAAGVHRIRGSRRRSPNLRCKSIICPPSSTLR